MHNKSIIYVSAALICATFIRWLVAQHSHSGQGKPPMFGDFEAQRHWMEITVNLPVAEWYRNTSDNDLLYWGLDYPVVTAYHSYLMGKFAKTNINETWMELHKSRGMEYPDFRMFMRTTVILSELLTYIPAAIGLICICRKMYGSCDSFELTLSILLLCPPLILIDHGHFQYNCVSLGFALAAFAFFVSVEDDRGDEFLLPHVNFCIGSILYVTALLYKQMELYHALPVFFFLLGKCFHQSRWIGGFTLLSAIGLTVVVSFLTLMLPFLIPDHQAFFDVLSRMFPVGRGLYEDKVASFWCALSTVWKFQNVLTMSQQLSACAAGCLLTFAPAAIRLLQNPHRQALLPAICISSLGFFLFSYHVHEKSILLASVPSLFLFDLIPVEITWFSVIAASSMLPLLMKDGLIVSFFGTHFVWASLVLLYFMMTPKSKVTGELFFPKLYLRIRPFLLVSSSLSGFLIYFCLLTNWPNPPVKLPYLYPLLVAVHSSAHYFLFLFIFYRLFFGFTSRSGKVATNDKKAK